MRVRIAVGIACVAATVLIARSVISGARELAHGVRLEEQGDLDGAVRHYRRAAKWYVPGSTHGDEAIERLEALAYTDEKEGSQRSVHSYRALQAIHASSSGARSFLRPYADARLRADRTLASSDESGELERSLTASHEAGAPFALSILCFWTFIFGTFGYLQKRRSPFRRTPRLLGALGASAFVGWLVCLSLV